MNKIKFTFICSIFTYGISLLHAVDPDLGERLDKTEARSAVFFPMGDRFTEVYGTPGLSLQLEQARRFQDYKNLELWGNLEWIFFGGKPSPSCGDSNLDMLNISIGLKAIGNVYHDWIYIYAGIGPDLGFLFIKNEINCCADCGDSETVHSSNIGVGGIGKTGCQIFFTNNFFLDLFVDYLYLPIEFGGSGTEDAGGFKIGGGLSGRY